MADEGDFPTTDDSMAASTKRLADWTFSLQGVGSDLKGVVNDLKDYWRKLTPVTAGGVSMAALIPESKEVARGISMRQGNQRQSFSLHLPKASGELTVILVLFVLLLVSMTINCLDYARNARNDEMLRLAEDRATKAETDLKTQVWLRSDSLTKENSALLGRIEAAEDLIQAYGISKTLRKPP
jgi:hypothetical protein